MKKELDSQGKSVKRSKVVVQVGKSELKKSLDPKRPKTGQNLSWWKSKTDPSQQDKRQEEAKDPQVPHQKIQKQTKKSETVSPMIRSSTSEIKNSIVVTPRDLSSAVFSCASLGYYSRELCDLAIQNIVIANDLTNITPQDRIRALFGVASLGHPVTCFETPWLTPQFLASLTSPLYVCQLIWSLVTLGFDPDNFSCVLSYLVDSENIFTQQRPAVYFLLPLLHLVLKNEKYQNLLTDLDISQEKIGRFEKFILEKIRSQTSEDISLATSSSTLERSLISLLRTKYQILPQAKQRIEGSHGLFVDACFNINNCQTVIEFDGPAHFALYPGYDRVMGKTAVKERMLRHLKIPCLRIPYWVGNPIGNAKEYSGDGRIEEPQAVLDFVENNCHQGISTV